MPNNRGSRIAASRARAQAKAHKKAHSTGPVIAAAAHVAPVTDDEIMNEDAPSALATEQAGDGKQAEAAAPAPAKTAPAVRRSNVSRTVTRQREAVVSLQSVNLKREVATIGIITAFIGIVLAVLKLATDIGA